MTTELDEIRAFRAEDAHVDHDSEAAARARLLTAIAANVQRSGRSRHPSWRPRSRTGQIARLIGHGARTLPLAISVVVVAAVVVVGFALHHANRGSSAASEPGSAQLKSILGVLRGPQTAAAKAFDHTGWPEVGFPDSYHRPGGHLRPDRAMIRFATLTPWGAKVFVVPLNPPSNRAVACANGVTKQTVAVWVQGLGWSDFNYPANIEQGEARGPGGPIPGPGHMHGWVELVPDGVAKVRYLRAQNLPRLGEPLKVTGTITAVVHNNIASFRVRSRGALLASWYNAQGRLIKHAGGDWHMYKYVDGRYISRPYSSPPPTHRSSAQCR
jgi:hypothetical protein